MPDKILEQFVSILLQHHETGGFDDVLGILDEFTTIGAQLIDIKRGVVEDIFQRIVDLIIIWELPLTESFNDAV